MTQKTPNVPRLQRLLGIALQTDHDTEVVAAVKAMRRVLAAGGADAHWLTNKLGDPGPPWLLAPVFTADPSEMLDFCGEGVSLLMLNERELDFVMSMSRKRGYYGDKWVLTPRQARWLKGIYERLKITRGA